MRVVRVVFASRFGDVRRRLLFRSNYLVSFFLRTNVRFLPRAKGATRDHEASLLCYLLSVDEARISERDASRQGAPTDPYALGRVDGEGRVRGRVLVARLERAFVVYQGNHLVTEVVRRRPLTISNYSANVGGVNGVAVAQL